jgi:ABC-type amino acid transport substrate-binding protein
VDAFMSDFPYTRRMVSMHDWVRVIAPPARFGETEYAFAVPKGQPAWVAALNDFISAARADGTLARAAERHGLTPILRR